MINASYLTKFAAQGVILRRRLGDEEQRNVVYTAVNVTNGNCYIGATSGVFKRRKYCHNLSALRGSKGSPKFYAAYRKYGKDAFIWFILAQAPTVDELMLKEIELIAKLSPEYNVTSGGRGIFGAPCTPEWRANQSRSLKGRKGVRYWLGKNHSAETRAKIRCAKLGVRHSNSLEALYTWQEKAQRLAAVKQGKPVICIGDGKRFDCLGFAAKHYELGLTPREVNNSHRKIKAGKPIKGKYFEYAETSANL